MRKLMMVSLLATVCSVTASMAAGWHHPLYLGNDGYWRQRIRVDVRNDMERAALGEPVAVRIGRGDGEADLVGALAEAVRVCDARGTEILFNITGSTGEQITKGPIAAGSVLTIPVECPAKATVSYFTYFDNPAAWRVPDFLETSVGVHNGALEQGSGDVPSHWRHDAQDEQHRVFWVSENPRSGKRCLKTVVAEGAEPTWIATRQHNVHIIGGARYVMRAWVKAENVEGYAGWYIHVGDKANFMMISPMLNGGGGTYDWKEVTAEFTAPREANIADLGTVLRGTGTAWFDDVSLECLDPSTLVATAAKPERLQLRETGGSAKWFDNNPNDNVHWDHRAAVRVRNFSDQPLDHLLVYADISTLAARLRGRMNQDSVRITDGSRLVPSYQLKDGLLFPAKVPARTAHTYYIYWSADRRIKSAGTSGYADLLSSARNLVKNPSFELGDGLSGDWPGGAEGEGPAGTVMGFDAPGLFGRRCAKMHIPHDAQKAWTGWRQNVPVEPGKTYLFAAWLRCEDVRDGSVQLHAHYRNAAGELCETKKFTGAGAAISGTSDWTLMSGMFTMPEDIATFQLHLTMLATGTVWHDGAVLVEVVPASVGKLESRQAGEGTELAAWQVNAIVKVFQDDAPPQKTAPPLISAARNEKEPLQLAVRSPKALKQVRVEVDPPVSAKGDRLTSLQVAVVGYVPIDHQTSYYRADSPPWQRKYPTDAGACDGWAGMWPDPLLPRHTFDLAANTTQPIWITVSVPRTAAAGNYVGKVRLMSGGNTVKEIPFTVHVWDFTLPDENHIAAIYDVRMGAQWSLPGKTPGELRQQFWRFMAERRMCPDRIYPDPVIRYENGKVIADFTEFDRAAEYYFNVLKLPSTYTPGIFYLFGWGHPPGNKWGEQPYEGAYPYEGVDRSKLRPEFKKAYQACLRAYWEHMKEKGWDKKCVLYISDEPFDSQPHIRQQMKALCDMIHEVDPNIPIYSSTWHHQPEWNGYLNVWGIGHYGVVAPEKMQERRAAGDRLWFTTDGQMCTDTPYCAVERLLPHYCFNYDVEAYEFWGIDWLTYNPYEFGWHAYIHQSDTPGMSYYVRYPNGDGFLAYPGGLIGHDQPVSSIRLEQAREGVEDYEYLYLLRDLVGKVRAAGKDASHGENALRKAKELVGIPNAGGRFSTRILPNPDAVFEVRETVAKAIEGLLSR